MALRRRRGRKPRKAMPKRRRGRVGGRRKLLKRSGRRIKGYRTAGFRGAYPSLDNYAMPGIRTGAKRRVGSLVNTRASKRRRVGIKGKGCPELAFQSARMGRYRPMTVNRLMTTLVPKVITRWQGVKPFMAQTVASAGVVAGYYDMRFTKDSVAVGRTRSAYPCYLISMDDFYQKTEVNGGFFDTMWRLNITGSGAPCFTAVTNTLFDGTVSVAPGLQWAQGSVYDQSYPRVNADTMYVQHKWHDFRFLFYGAKTQPTNYEIIVFRPTDQYMDPREQIATYDFNGGTGAEIWNWPNEQQRDEYSNFWASQVNALVANPILPKPTQKSNWKVKILKRVTIEVPCRQEYQEVQAPNAKEFKFFMRDDRLLNLQWGAPTEAYRSDATDKDNRVWSTTQYNVQLQRENEVEQRPRPRARTYMIVRALNYISATPATVPDPTSNIDNTPSFDLVWRRKSHLGCEGSPGEDP